MEVAGEAADGLEAVKKIGQVRPDIVIMDIAMPVLSGIEATYRSRLMEKFEIRDITGLVKLAIRQDLLIIE